MSQVRQWATELLASAGRRPDIEPIMIQAGRARAIAQHVLESSADDSPPKADLTKPSTVPVKNASQKALELLEVAGTMKMADLQQALGQPNQGATKTMVLALEKKKKVRFDKNTLEVSLVA